MPDREAKPTQVAVSSLDTDTSNEQENLENFSSLTPVAQASYIAPNVIRRAKTNPNSLTPANILALQRIIGNRATLGILERYSGVARLPFLSSAIPSQAAHKSESAKQPNSDFELERTIQTAPLSNKIIQREYITSPQGVLYKGSSSPEIELGVGRYTKVSILEKDIESQRTKVKVEAGKFKGREGWINSDELSEEFPSFDNFDIPNMGQTIPPLYHGSDRDAILSIMHGGFKVTKEVKAGRTYGDGVYATPYVSKAAHHAANTGHTHNKPEFAVGSVSVKPSREIIPKNIMVHDMVKENAYVDQSKGNLLKATELQHGKPFAEVAEKLLPNNVKDISYKEITAAARWLGKDVIIYKGESGHIVYVFLKWEEVEIKRIVIEDVSPQNTAGWENLEWYHEAQDKDRIQGELNKL